MASKRATWAPVLFLGVGLSLLLVAWIGATRPFTAPDEADHYLRAVGLADGQLLGPKVPWLDPAISRAQRLWVDRDTRGVVVSPSLSPPQRGCEDGKANVGPRGCIEGTHVGDYLPLPYLLPALAVGASSNEHTGGWLARAGSALPSLIFIFLAVALLWSNSLWSVLGLLVAVAPMVLFVGSVTNPNGLEICAALACMAAVLRLARPCAARPGWVWAALAGSGVVTTLSWQLGPLFVIGDAVLLAAVLGWAGLRELAAENRKALRTVGLALGVSIAVYLVYGSAAGMFHATVRLSPLGHGLHLGLGQLGGVLHQAVGVFGPLTIALPSGTYWIWWALDLALLGGAWAVGERRDRTVLALATLIALAFPVLFYAWSYRYTGFPLQGRYVLPALAVIPLLSGEVLHRRQERIAPRFRRALPVVGVTVIAAFQLLAWWIAARSAANGGHGVAFWAGARWSPPVGWWPWVGLAVSGAVSMFAATVTTVLLEPDPRTSPGPLLRRGSAEPV